MSEFNVYARLCGALILVFITNIVAAEPIKALEPIHYGGKIVLFLSIIVAVIVFLAWLVSKSKLAAGMGIQGHAEMKLVAVLSLGIKEKIAVVQVAEKQFLVGITASQINLISELEQPLNTSDKTTTSFSDFLKKAMRS